MNRLLERFTKTSELSKANLQELEQALEYFSLSEFKCSETGTVDMDIQFLRELDSLRDICGFPFVITSGYRHPEHSIEAAKEKPGFHSQGLAVDIHCDNSVNRYTLIDMAMQHGFKGIGIADTFVHLDMRPTISVVWTY